MSASLVPRDPGTAPAGQRGRVTDSARSKPKIREAPTKNWKGDMMPMTLPKFVWEGITIPLRASGPSYLKKSRSSGRTTNTGQEACRTIFSATLPMSMCGKPVRPWVVSTNKSTPNGCSS